MMEIQETKKIWIAVTNTDCTEGRGFQRPKAICETKATAIRLGKKGYIQGSDCPVEDGIAVKVNDRWFYPWIMERASKEDIAAQKKLDEYQAVLNKARELGLTPEDIKALCN